MRFLHRPDRFVVLVAATALALAACEGSAVSESGDDPTTDAEATAPDDTGAGTGATTAATADPAPVRVGLVNPVTGPFAALGEDVIDSYPDTSQFWTYDPDEFMAGPPLAQRKGTWE